MYSKILVLSFIVTFEFHQPINAEKKLFFFFINSQIFFRYIIYINITVVMYLLYINYIYFKHIQIIAATQVQLC